MGNLKIYLIEDDDDHAELVNYNIAKIGNSEIIYRSSDGEEAMSTINQISCEEIERPDLIMLDINIPKLDGIEVLKNIKSIEGLCSIPIVAFTTSDSEKDKVRAYKNHINSYIVKPADFDEMGQSIEEIVKYWSDFNSV